MNSYNAWMRTRFLQTVAQKLAAVDPRATKSNMLCRIPNGGTDRPGDGLNHRVNHNPVHAELPSIRGHILLGNRIHLQRFANVPNRNVSICPVNFHLDAEATLRKYLLNMQNDLLEVSPKA